NGRRVLVRLLVREWIRNPDARRPGIPGEAVGCDWIPEDPEQTEEPLPVLVDRAQLLAVRESGSQVFGPGGEQRSQHRPGTRHERTPRPPDMETVDRRMLTGRVLPSGFDSQLPGGQPLLDKQSGSCHVHSSANRMRSALRA